MSRFCCECINILRIGEGTGSLSKEPGFFREKKFNFSIKPIIENKRCMSECYYDTRKPLWRSARRIINKYKLNRVHIKEGKSF